MNMESKHVLFVGGISTSWPLLKSLEADGYQFRLADSCSEAARLAEQGYFDLILCSGRMKDFDALLNAALKSSASVFRYVPVEDGYWWLPTVLNGGSCARVPAFREDKLKNALATMVREVRSYSLNSSARQSADVAC